MRFPALMKNSSSIRLYGRHPIHAGKPLDSRWEPGIRVGRWLSSSATLFVPHSHPEEVLDAVQAGMGMVSSHKVALEKGANVITIGARGVMKVTPFIPLILRRNGQTLIFEK